MRSRNGAAQWPDAQHDGHAAHAAPWPVRDDQIGHIFRSMRGALKVPRETLARRLAVSPATLDDFEAGALHLLPPWKETTRIVNGYCELLRLDPQPILWRLQTQLLAAASQPPPRTGAPASGGSRTPNAAPASTHRSEGTRTRGLRRARPRARTMFAVSAPVMLIVGMGYLVHLAPRPCYRVAAMLPAPLESILRFGIDQAAHIGAPRRDGLKWIDVGDPRLRKANKLNTAR